MAKKTVLDIVQDILNDLDSDEVNSINDTIEATQVAYIIRSTYEDMIATRDWPHTKRLIQLESLSDNTRPTHLLVPTLVKRLEIVNYDKARQSATRRYFEPVRYVDNDTFLRRVNSFNDAEPNIVTVTDPSGVTLAIRNDIPPAVFTSFDDEHIVFDSYDSNVDSVIQSSKIQAIGYVEPLFELRDDFIPDLPSEAFTALAEEAKSRASLKLRQAVDQKAEQTAQKNHRWLSRNSWRVRGGVTYDDYGRKSVKHRTFINRNRDGIATSGGNQG